MPWPRKVTGSGIASNGVRLPVPTAHWQNSTSANHAQRRVRYTDVSTGESIEPRETVAPADGGKHRSRRAVLKIAMPLVAALAATIGIAYWVHSIGGPESLAERYGWIAPLVSFPSHILVSLTPAGEFIPVAAANGAVYGFLLGAAMNWLAWMSLAAVQHAYGRYATAGIAGSLPARLRRLPVGHPLVLICARWFPGGSSIINAAAGAAGVPLARLAAYAAIGHIPQALIMSAAGAGVVALL